MNDLGQTKFCLGLQLEHLYSESIEEILFWYICISSYLCPESIGEIQYGQVISNKNPDGSEILRCWKGSEGDRDAQEGGWIRQLKILTLNYGFYFLTLAKPMQKINYLNVQLRFC